MPSGDIEGVYSNADLLDIGLGLHPNLTGRGKGAEFIKAGLEFADSVYQPNGFRLSVAEFNKRAVSMYQKIGFEITADFQNTTENQSTRFLVMEKLN